MDTPKPWCSINTISSVHLFCHCNDLDLHCYCFVFALGSDNVVQPDYNHWNSSTPSASTVKTPNGPTMHTYIIFPSHKHSAKGLKSDSITGVFHTTCGTTRCYHQSEEDGGVGDQLSRKGDRLCNPGHHGTSEPHTGEFQPACQTPSMTGERILRGAVRATLSTLDPSS